MAEPGDDASLPQATVVRPKRLRISVIWIIPILAALVALGIAIQRYRAEGPTIIILFHAAEGIEAGKTLIRYKDVPIGKVTAINLTRSYNRVEVTAKINKRAEGLMAEDARFWVVRPVISLTGVQALNTLLSGNYIGFEPGKSETMGTTFIGLDEAPVITEQGGRKFVLNADDLGSLEAGAPIYYRRILAGHVTGYELARDGTSVQIKVFIDPPFDRLIFPGTRFWDASGIEIKAGADGLTVRTESVAALLAGGLAFETPPFEPRTTLAPENAAFTLYRDRTAALKAPDPDDRRYALHFNESLRGLAPGAPVTFLGLPAGEVTAVGVDFDPDKGTLRSRVQVAFSTERLTALAASGAQQAAGKALARDEAKRRAFLKRLFEEKGLRAQLRTGSLVSGALYVAFDYYPGEPKAKVDLARDEPELPVVPSTLASLELKLGSILDKVDRLPLDAVAKALQKDLEHLDLALADARKLITDADTKLVPGFVSALEDLRRALGAVERAASSANASVLDSNAALQEDLRHALHEFTRAARSVRVLTDQLEREPSALIRGKSGPGGGK